MRTLLITVLAVLLMAGMAFAAKEFDPEPTEGMRVDDPGPDEGHPDRLPGFLSLNEVLKHGAASEVASSPGGGGPLLVPPGSARPATPPPQARSPPPRASLGFGNGAWSGLSTRQHRQNNA